MNYMSYNTAKKRSQRKAQRRKIFENNKLLKPKKVVKDA